VVSGRLAPRKLAAGCQRSCCHHCSSTMRPATRRVRSLASALMAGQAWLEDDVLGATSISEHVTTMSEWPRPSPQRKPRVPSPVGGGSPSRLPAAGLPPTLGEHTASMAGSSPSPAGPASTLGEHVSSMGSCGEAGHTHAHLDARKELIATARGMNASGINQGTSGNISVRAGDDGFLITPSGIPYDTMQPEHIVYMELSSAGFYGDHLPSSEWRFHFDIYLARPDAFAILHAHSTYCTALSALGQAIPAFHYMIASGGGKTIPCANYETFSTQALSDSILSAMSSGVRGCLMANHGMICFDKTLKRALNLAVEIECLARQYTLACSIGTPAILSDSEMDVILAKFQTYGKQPGELAGLMSSSAFLKEHAIIPPERMNI
jgi:L-fuculose-phosphate aldolase